MRLLSGLCLLIFLAVSAGAQLSDLRCVEGKAGPYPCRSVDLLAFIPRAAFDAESLNDVWGWTDPLTGREYALVGLSNGTAFVDITQPARPVIVGKLPTRTVAAPWRSVKVYSNHMYVVADHAGLHGVQVFDLTRLRNATPGTTFRETSTYFGPGLALTFGNQVAEAHSVAVNEESGFLYVVGSRTACSGGLHMVDVRTPARPRFAGCFSADGYTHDTQCVTYRGSDPDHRGREVCLAANEDTLTIVDVTDKRKPRMLSRSTYAGRGYTHQGWLTEDHNYFLLNDELDEVRLGGPTRTIIWDVRNLDQPIVIGEHLFPTRSVDHNLYIHKGLVFESNYTAGLRVLDVSNVAAGRLTEIGFFDVVPENDDPDFSGTWSNYPFFSSGTVAVSGIEQGLFLVRVVR